ncbi:MAG: protein-L-isoaspartate(D-aspartate) O-methyltransferase [Candidatus Hodarchaeales archaeon]
MKDLEEQKKRLAESYLRSKYAKNQTVADAFLSVPREEFVLPKQRRSAYQDTPLPLMKQQTISAPHMCVLILSYGKFSPGHRVLEIGTGSGYQAALMAEMVKPTGQVYTIERIMDLAEFAQQNLEKTGYAESVTVIAGDGTEGWPEPDIPPFDRIIITAAGPQIPPPLIEQLKINGSLHMPLGQPFRFQEWIEVEKISETEIRKRTHTGVSFVPLIGKYGVK